MTTTTPRRVIVGCLFASLSLWCGAGHTGEKARRPVKVTIQDEKPVVVETALPFDATPRIRYTPANLIAQIQSEQGQQLHLSHFPVINIDGRVMQPGQQGGRFEKVNQALPKSATGKVRRGFTSVFFIDDLRITLTAELVPTKPGPGEKKRELGTMLFRYVVENTGKQPRKFGLKDYLDMYVITNDGAMFAAPNFPNKILDGIELKGKTLPDYVQCLQNPDLKNPGYISHITVNLGSSIEKADRVVLSRHGAGGFGGWDMPAIASMGDSGVGIFFDPKEIKPGGRRDFGFAYGKGVAIAPESEGNVEVRLTGSFEPGKTFTVTALVHDPVVGQSLILELPKGMTLVEGREIQPVPVPTLDPPQSFVEWKCRLEEMGDFPLRVRSSTGVTQTKLIKISAAE
jgi:hypothetical protein